jgi:hypothetical protein
MNQTEPGWFRVFCSQSIPAQKLMAKELFQQAHLASPKLSKSCHQAAWINRGWRH